MTSFEMTGQFFISDSKNAGEVRKQTPNHRETPRSASRIRRRLIHLSAELADHHRSLTASCIVELLTGTEAGRAVEIAYGVVNLAETGQTRALVKDGVSCARKVHRPDA